ESAGRRTDCDNDGVIQPALRLRACVVVVCHRNRSGLSRGRIPAGLEPDNVTSACCATLLSLSGGTVGQRRLLSSEGKVAPGPTATSSQSALRRAALKHFCSLPRAFHASSRPQSWSRFICRARRRQASTKS